MEINKYYSLDECSDKDMVYEKLDSYQADDKIQYSVVDPDVIKIKDLELSVKETKEILQFFSDYSVIDYPDYTELGNDDWDDDWDEDVDNQEDYF